MISLKSCLKSYTRDQDKAVPPAETVARVKARLRELGPDVLKETRRIDTGRLGIPVYLSVCGDDAKRIMPTRKQMGKGASPDQAEASALMELVERYCFFTFWDTPSNFTPATYSQALERWPGQVIPLERIIRSVGENLDPADAKRAMDLTQWRFYPATNLTSGQVEYVPLDWFKKLSEFNGSSAGNTSEESIFQGACELVERHVCAIVDTTRPELPTISPKSCTDPVLASLLRCFTDNGLKVWLKDFTLGMPAPTVAAMAYDPATFPGMSEIVYTAGTASSPAKAAIRALTEVAQLGGDFETGAVYEASGLQKFERIEDTAWLRNGPEISLDSLPNIEDNDIRQEIENLIRGLEQKNHHLYSLETTIPALEVAANYNFVPGFEFRERDKHASLGLFIGRILAEEAEPAEAIGGLETLRDIYGQAHFLPFFEGMLSLRLQDLPDAHDKFLESEPLQPDPDKQGLAAFYSGYTLTLMEDWAGSVPHLDRAIALCPELKEYYNLRGVANFKQNRYEDAARDFNSALNIDRGSVMDLANLGICYKFLGEKEKARDFLESALKIDPSLDFAREHLDNLG